jgi:hypothetical protein
VATREALDRWRSALLDIEQFDAQPTGQKVRSMLGSPEARTNIPLLNAIPVFRTPQRMLTTPFSDLWSQDPPTDPALVAVLQPVLPVAQIRYSFSPLAAMLATVGRRVSDQVIGYVTGFCRASPNCDGRTSAGCCRLRARSRRASTG